MKKVLDKDAEELKNNARGYYGFHWNQKGPGLLSRRGKNPLWNEGSRQHQQNPVGAEDHRHKTEAFPITAPPFYIVSDH